MDKEKVESHLKKIFGEKGVISDREELIAFECDGLTNHRISPLFAVFPESTKQVSELLRYCYKQSIPFTPRGAGTGLSGGALPHEKGILVCMSKMDRILEVDIENEIVVVEPGVINRKVTDAVSDWGYYYAPDPSSQVICTIGGNIAENAGGVHCLKYGVTTDHILGVELVLPDGEVVSLGGKTPDTPGYDLRGLLVGSEGMLGIVTKAVLRIIKKPETARTFLASFKTIEDAGNSVSKIISAGIIPAGMEIMDNLSIKAVQQSMDVGYPKDAEAILILELDGPAVEVETHLPLVKRILDANNAVEIKTARDEKERELFWKGRKSAFAAMGRISPQYYVQDGVIPRSELGRVLSEIKSMSSKVGLRVANVFHAGDGNLHPLILFDASKKGEIEKAEKLAAFILRSCVKAGGSITGEHGVGYDKKNYMSLMFSKDDIDTMNLVSSAFDEKGISNPGKMFPTPKTCTEPGTKTHPLHKEETAELF